MLRSRYEFLFSTTLQEGCLKANVKFNQGHLFLVNEGFVFVERPALYLPFADLAVRSPLPLFAPVQLNLSRFVPETTYSDYMQELKFSCGGKWSETLPDGPAAAARRRHGRNTSPLIGFT
jgi:hypothetical protein